MSDQVYCYPPDYDVLRNRLNIRDATELDRAERLHISIRLRQGPPNGDFDLIHLRAIHRHLFQDIYDWAGEIRTVEISKGRQQFQFLRFIEAGMADVHRRIEEADRFVGLGADAFATGAAEMIGDVNYVHPFREGNGRTQAVYLKQLASEAGLDLDLTKLDRDTWMEASVRAHAAEYAPMADCIRQAITGG